MPWGAIASAVISAVAQGSASGASSGGYTDAASEQARQFNITQQNMAPWLKTGQGAIGRLGDLYGLSGNTTAQGYGSFNQPFTLTDLMQDPGYQFRLQQGTQNIMNQRSALGGLLSGNTLRGLTEYGQNMASNEYSNAYARNRLDPFNQLSNLAGMGQTQSQALGQLGQQYANAYGNNLIGAGNARAQGILGMGNAFSGGLNSALGNYRYSNFLDNYMNRPSDYGSYWSGGGGGGDGGYSYGGGGSTDYSSGYW